MKSNNYWF